jgi:hypothetical protein
MGNDIFVAMNANNSRIISSLSLSDSGTIFANTWMGMSDEALAKNGGRG